jgi:hypothetical protein
MSQPVLALAHQLWSLVQLAMEEAEGQGNATRFASHLGLALVALGVVPRNSGVPSSLSDKLMSTALSTVAPCGWR